MMKRLLINRVLLRNAHTRSIHVLFLHTYVGELTSKHYLSTCSSIFARIYIYIHITAVHACMQLVKFRFQCDCESVAAGV